MANGNSYGGNANSWKPPTPGKVTEARLWRFLSPILHCAPVLVTLAGVFIFYRT